MLALSPIMKKNRIICVNTVSWVIQHAIIITMKESNDKLNIWLQKRSVHSKVDGCSYFRLVMMRAGGEFVEEKATSQFLAALCSFTIVSEDLLVF